MSKKSKEEKLRSRFNVKSEITRTQIEMRKALANGDLKGVADANEKIKQLRNKL
ncbi:hypothetical protein [Sporanaerobium hydrogeniformans]|uniref:hypothetical protein n=1 Tax=Sporanaerobium hydrogeniformans TaxID=3072179 RepID=UPI0015D4E9C5|nr:hypothetical protein [Sporanaerobium hydrogeniformans]